ncbi:alcohol dehydrogenase catalytic domain-containing protein [Anaerococcus sp. AGMB00486]|uniref:Alcohol dehydrogenase catalytic domain-containing protein n=2 Tax=Anaerococcus TaxID=165779 RepID=A0ABX2NA70_9FIRM|nr:MULTISPECIES: alcohol dehydrogenase catalytic domain-containing protein [Anaerococcus]MSS77736.1 alcohol dehydrogenase catalytic domain-containing protein [Anaerococcus porci]NVF11591.1 alcohol dehydrogenase catalytic domain-containing protein [Anaerococcus faecalis]
MKFNFYALTKKNKIELFSRDMSAIEDDEILVKQMACNICTTDYQQWQGKREHQGYPMAGGHECAGIVVAKGKNVGDSFGIGDHVAIVYDYCGVCESCKKGYITNCENIDQFGKNYSSEFYGIFGFADYFKRKAKSFVKLSKKLDFSEGAFVEPLSSVIAGIDKLTINSESNVIVIGSGTMGILNALYAKSLGANVIILGTNEKKNKVANRLSLDTINPKDCSYKDLIKEKFNKKLADIAIVAAGSSSANQQSLDLTKNYDAQILFYAAGYPKPELKVDSNMIHYRRLNMYGAYGSKLYDFNRAADLLSNNSINVKPLIEAKYKFSDIDDAFKKAATKDSFRVSLILNEEK